MTVIRGKYDDARDPGAINHFQALLMVLSGTVGLGNIAGVALAISVGGPGALFWMWVAGLMGMAIKSVEVTLAMMYRDTSDPDNPRGGAMWVIRRGFGDKYGPIASWFARIVAALFCWSLLLATITSGNMFQSWNVANITEQYFDVPPLATGVVMATMTGLVIIGGIRRIGDVTGMLVPFMCGLYLIAGIVVLIIEAANVPSLLAYVVRDAFSPSHAEGAFLGALLWFGITTGLRRTLLERGGARDFADRALGGEDDRTGARRRCRRPRAVHRHLSCLHADGARDPGDRHVEPKADRRLCRRRWRESRRRAVAIERVMDGRRSHLRARRIFG